MNIHNDIYPRPQFRRNSFFSLDGKWDFCEDASGQGLSRGYPAGFASDSVIVVPFSPECAQSGIHNKNVAGVVWYQRLFDSPELREGQRCLLNFDGVDYRASVWVNGRLLGTHEGAYVRFTLDATDALIPGANRLVVRAEDGQELDQPRGKQRWMDHNYSCWYVQTTGIWKSVWMEVVANTRLESVKFTPIIHNYTLKVDYALSCGDDQLDLELAITREGVEQKRLRLTRISESGFVMLDMISGLEEFQVAFWRPEEPNLYDVRLSLYQGGTLIDEVDSYFGFRDFRQEGGRLCLNGMPVYEKLVLYQGYWGRSGLTAPDDASVIRDLETIRALGYNGLRVHQKIETDRFMYHADRMGLFVWCEMPSPHLFSDTMKMRMTREWLDIVKQQYNHPSLITWLIFNESWGVRGIRTDEEQQSFVNGLYYLTKSFDSMRPVIGNDGWEQVLTDIVSIHNYEQEGDRLFDAYADRQRAFAQDTARLVQHPAFAEGYQDNGLPVILSEFGGCGFPSSGESSFVYSESATEEEYYTRFHLLTDAVKRLDYLSGYCYTQFSDVEQEKNGLVTMDRHFKVDPIRIRAINEALPSKGNVAKESANKPEIIPLEIIHQGNKKETMT